MRDTGSTPTPVELALSNAKGIQKDVRILVQQLAQIRDSETATTQEGTSKQ